MNKTIRWLWEVSGRKKGYVLALTLIQTVTGGAGVLYALLLRNIVDSATVRDLPSFRQNAISLAALVLILLLIDAILNRLYERMRADMENLFKKRLTDTILRKDYASVSTVHSGEWMARLTSDTAIVANGYADLLPGLAGTIIRLISALFMIIALDRRFAAVLIPCCILLVLLTRVFRNVLKRLHKNIQESDGRLRSFLQERIGSLMIVKAFSAEEQVSAGAREKMQEHKAARMKRNAFSTFCSVGFGGAMECMYLIGVIYCAYGILSGTVTYGTLTAIMQLIGQVQGPFASLSGFIFRFYAMTASAERLMEAEAFPNDCPEPMLEPETVQTYYREQFQALVLRDISFSYPLRERPEERQTDIPTPVLHGLNLEIRKGEIVAFSGISGCGKTTVLKLLMCLYAPDAGERLLIGRDKSFPLTAKWRRLFSYVPQGNQLMSGKLRDVVAFACPEQAQNDEKLLRALNIACANEFLPDLEDGLDTLLGEHGAGLSEGQMQRLAIARAVFSDSPVLLLDEATSALDEKTEKRLLQNLRCLTDKTIIIVTHRKAVLSVCDRVLIFTESGVEENRFV